MSNDIAGADLEDISASEDQIVDVNRTGAASLQSDKFATGSDIGDNTDDDDDVDDDEIFRPPEVAAGSEMVSSAVTASNEYSGINVNLAADSTLSPSSSYDTLPSVPVLQPEQHRQLSLPSSADDDDDPMLQAIDLAESQDEGTTENIATVRQGDIGCLTNHDELAVVFLARMLCSEFLLTGYICGLLPDHQVRVSVKALALSCIGHLVDLYPQLIVMNLHKTSPEPGNSLIFSILWFV